MKTEMLSQEQNKVTIKVEIDPADFQKNVNSTIRDLSTKINIPGFRKGKVPRKVLEMRFSKEAIYTETLDNIMPGIIREIVHDYELDLIDEPDLKVENMNEGELLVLVLKFEVKPEVTLPELGSIKVDKKEVQVTEDMVDATIKQAQDQFAEYNQVENRSAVESGDLVDISYTTRVLDENGEEVKSHEPGETTIDLSTEGLKEEIVKSLTGQEIGTHVDVEISIEEDNPDSDIAGKKAEYSIDIKGIKEKVLPEMNEDFFKKITGEEGLALSDFRKNIEKGILARLEEEARVEMENIAVDKLAELSDLFIPDTLVERQEASIREQDEENFKKRFNKSIEEFFEGNSLDKEEYEKNMKDQARKAVARYLVMDALSTRENVEVTKEDIQNEIAQIAHNYNIDPERLMGSMLNDSDRIGEISSRIRYRKTVDILLDDISIIENNEDPEKPEEPVE